MRDQSFVDVAKVAALERLHATHYLVAATRHPMDGPVCVRVQEREREGGGGGWWVVW